MSHQNPRRPAGGLVSLLLTLVLSLTLTACATAQAQSSAPTTAVVSTSEATSAAAGTATPAVSVATGSVATTSAKLNLNTATQADLLAGVPELGSRMVREFLEYRPYVSIQQFRREIGKYVDAAQVAAYEQYVFVPIAVNDADADTLQQLPGVDASAAATLIAGRPYASNDAFLAKLADLTSPADLALAPAYLSTP